MGLPQLSETVAAFTAAIKGGFPVVKSLFLPQCSWEQDGKGAEKRYVEAASWQVVVATFFSVVFFIIAMAEIGTFVFDWLFNIIWSAVVGFLQIWFMNYCFNNQNWFCLPSKICVLLVTLSHVYGCVQALLWSIDGIQWIDAGFTFVWYFIMGIVVLIFRVPVATSAVKITMGMFNAGGGGGGAAVAPAPAAAAPAAAAPAAEAAPAPAPAAAEEAV